MRGLLDWWNSLSQGVRDGIISTVASGVFLTVVAAIFKLSGRSLKAGLRKLVGGGPEANQPLQQRHEIVVKVEPPQPLPRIEQPKPEEPKPESRRLPAALLEMFPARLWWDLSSAATKTANTSSRD